MESLITKEKEIKELSKRIQELEKYNGIQKETVNDAHSLSPPSPTPPPPSDLPSIECDPNVLIKSCDLCGKTVHKKKDIVSHKFYNHIQSINNCTNLVHNYFNLHG